jgi:hypothetical protein
MLNTIHRVGASMWLLASASACSPPICSLLPPSGLIVFVSDAVTHALICDAQVTATTGAVEILLRPNDPVDAEQPRTSSDPGACSYTNFSGPSVYNVEVSRVGFVTQTMSGITVPSTTDGCHNSITQTVIFQLEPQ